MEFFLILNIIEITTLSLIDRYWKKPDTHKHIVKESYNNNDNYILLLYANAFNIYLIHKLLLLSLFEALSVGKALQD